MSLRTDGFEPSAYTIPPPRPGLGIQWQLKPGTLCHGTFDVLSCVLLTVTTAG
jgi:hypothetical protein